MERWWQKSCSGMALMRDWPPWNIRRRNSWHKPAPAVSQIQFQQSVFHTAVTVTLFNSCIFVIGQQQVLNVLLIMIEYEIYSSNFLLKQSLTGILVWLNWKLLFRSMLTLTFVSLIHRLVIMENVTVNCTWKRKVTMVMRRSLWWLPQRPL